MSSLQLQCQKALGELQLPDNLGPLQNAVRSCTANNNTITVRLELPPQISLRRTVTQLVYKRLQQLSATSKIRVEMVDQISQTTPPPHTAPPSDGTPRAAQRSTYLQSYRQVIAVGSGKGGVGKSTVAVNLALALQQLGHQVSLFDADIYGPSLPIMLGLRSAKPQISQQKRIQPLRAYGLSVLSIGNLIEEAAATIWRGPIVHQIIEQLLRDTDWPGGDFMIIDLPPGTGDAPLTLSQLVQLQGAVIVSTPQDVALLDAVKAIAMFEKVAVPILGLVENMSRFLCPHCQTPSDIFDHHTVQKTCGQYGVPFLGSIPIDIELRKGGDSGQPPLAQTLSPSDHPAPAQKALLDIGRKLLTQLDAAAASPS